MAVLQQAFALTTHFAVATMTLPGQHRSESVGTASCKVHRYTDKPPMTEPRHDRAPAQARGAGASPVDAARAELLERLGYFTLAPRVVLDLGTGSGVAATALRQRYPRALLVALDRSAARLREARLRQRFWRRHPLLCAEPCALPLASGSVDVVFSHLLADAGDELPALLDEIHRVLRPGGLLLASCLGAGSGAGEPARPDITTLAAALAAAGLAEPVVDRDTHAGAAPVEILYAAAFAAHKPGTTSLPQAGAIATIAAGSIKRRKT